MVEMLVRQRCSSTLLHWPEEREASKIVPRTTYGLLERSRYERPGTWMTKVSAPFTTVISKISAVGSPLQPMGLVPVNISVVLFTTENVSRPPVAAFAKTQYEPSLNRNGFIESGRKSWLHSFLQPESSIRKRIIGRNRFFIVLIKRDFQKIFSKLLPRGIGSICLIFLIFETCLQ